MRYVLKEQWPKQEQWSKKEQWPEKEQWPKQEQWSKKEQWPEQEQWPKQDMRWGEIRDLSDHSAPSPFPPRFFSWISRPRPQMVHPKEY